MDMCETNRTQLGTIPGLATMYDAFNNIQFQAGVVSCSKLTKAGIDDIQIKVGYDAYKNSCEHIAPYGVVTIPTGSHPCSSYLFEPLVGSYHTSLGLGLGGDKVLWEENECRLTFLADIKYRYILPAQERRSFDLNNNGDWSRYLRVIQNTEPLVSYPAINYFTLPVQVNPRNTIEAWCALNRNFEEWDLEIGYNFWWRQAEKIFPNNLTFQSPLTTNSLGIYVMSLSGIVNNPESSNMAQINQSLISSDTVSTDSIFIPTTLANLNYSSGAHPSSISNKVYLAASHDLMIGDTTIQTGLGASYEIGHGLSAFNQWALWGIAGIDF